MSLKDKNSHTNEIFDIIIGDTCKLNHVIEHNVLHSVGENIEHKTYVCVQFFMCPDLCLFFFC